MNTYYHITPAIYKASRRLVKAKIELDNATVQFECAERHIAYIAMELKKGYASQEEWEDADLGRDHAFVGFNYATEEMNTAKKLFKECTTFLFLMHAGNDKDLVLQAKTIMSVGITDK